MNIATFSFSVVCVLSLGGAAFLAGLLADDDLLVEHHIGRSEARTARMVEAEVVEPGRSERRVQIADEVVIVVPEHAGRSERASWSCGGEHDSLVGGKYRRCGTNDGDR